ncbi:TIGR02171 family protein [Fibrobacter sp. UWB11]|uniref:TIGR02171 family lipoprotein n=1 Tax=Fibrobacter sp. UWB11 TaxID=1896202 RepID=UPI000926151D|nr:TIGR02171 family protein [Fibrobacter sp. UWB11]SIO09689.1 TIGR02171 family protein [Fibrobacter sp. UWB11]
MKKAVFVGTSFLVGSFLLSCSDDSPTQTEMGSSLVCSSQENCSDVTLQEDFALIRSSGKVAELGTNSKSAKANERPQMDVKFTYDFQLGKHEVTCGEFNALMDKKGGVKLDCEKESLPAVNVTYYDAVLFANAKSKAAGMDTAYTYSSAEFDKNGHCNLLNGFVFKPDVEAFRLPTEAEWSFAAGLSFNVYKSWNVENSGSKAHEVCTKKDENGLCDMLGNVTEWVNDWLGNFRDTSITNYVGGADGGNLGERVIKGGNYRTAISDINLYARGDVYTVTGTSASDYLGFRLAYGKIENPVWLDASGSAVASNLSLVASSQNITPLFGTSKSKLAFRNYNTKNLVFVDFRRVSPTIVEIKDTIDVYHPDISPDGKRVAFCTREEGLSGASSVYVRDLNAEGSNLVKLDVKSAAIPRWRVLENGDTVIVYVTDAGNNKDESVFKSASTWQVKFANGKFGEPQKLFDGAYHGGISDDESLTVTGARVLRARVAAKGSIAKSDAKDTLWYNGEQACNASLNKKSKRTLFLDFGGETGRTFVGEKYRTHERLLIADNNGKLVSSVAAPSGYTFDHSEWVLNDENVAVVTLANADGAHKKIALVNTKDSSVTVLVEGEEIWHPCFWVSTGNSSESSNWDADSVGVYVSAGNQTNYLLSHKMPMFWKLKDSVEFIGLGNSHMWAGFDPSQMSVSAMNMGVVPCDMHCIHYLFENYVVNHASKVKYVAVGLDIDLWYNIDKRMDINLCRGDALGFVYDEKHEFYPDGVDNAFVDLVMENAVDEAQSVIKERGWYAASDNRGWADENGHVVIDPDSTWSNCLFNKNLSNCLVDEDQNTCLSKYTMSVCMNDVVDTNYNMCLAKHSLDQCLGIFTGDIDKLKDLVRIAKERNIVVIGVVFPVSPEYKKTGAYSRHGMLRSHAKKILDEINEFAEAKSNFFVFDENKFGDHDYPSSMANDYDHLNKDGAIQFSKRLNEFVKSIDSGKSSK